MDILIEVLGYAAFILILAAYFFNIRGYWKASAVPYILCNLFGGIFFIINTWFHHAYPSMVLNIVWVVIAVSALLKKEQKAETTK